MLTLEAERAGRGGAIQKVTYTANGGRRQDEAHRTGAEFRRPRTRRTGRSARRTCAGGPPPGAGPGGPPAAGRGPGGPGGGRGGQPQVVELARVSTEAPKALPPRPEPVTLPMPTTPVKYNGMAKTPPMGWNSWNKFRNQVSDKMVREMADAIVRTGMRDAGYIYVNIDDTWESAARDASRQHYHQQQIPRHESARRLHPQQGPQARHLLLARDPRTCAGYLGSYQHEEQDAKTYAAWGIDYLKYDWCSASQVYDNTQATMAAAYHKMGLGLLNSGRTIVYSLCQYGNLDVGEWGEKVGGNLWRTTGDISDRWASMENIGFKLQPGREKYAGPGHWNDPDMLEVGNGGMTDTEYQTHMSLWCLLAAPLLAGNDIRDMKPVDRRTSS